MGRTILCVFVLVVVFLPLAVADPPVKGGEQPEANAPPDLTWIGKLVDQTCKEKNIDHNCPVGPSTERFGLVIDGGIILPFDEKSNEMARETVAKDGRKGNIEVDVVGSRQGGLFKLQSIEVKK
jgi:hypothetical protein